MSRSVIDILRSESPEGRAEFMETTYQHNLEYFKEKHPALLSVLDNVKCPYSFSMTENFVNVIDERTGKPAHPENSLDTFAEAMGDWLSPLWTDLFNFNVVAPEQYPIHNRPVKDFSRSLFCRFPEYPIRYAQKKINLKILEEDKRFSPPTVFLGIFHGLHIDYFLSRSDVAYFLFVEPDMSRFEVSCYFLDYRKIKDKFGMFVMSVGHDVEASPIYSFFSNYHASRHMWVRVLPGYEHERNAHFVESFRTLQTSLASVIYPIDHEIEGLQNALNNLVKKRNVLTSVRKLSSKSKIAIIAAGPSLNSDMDWLKKNQDKLIIFAVQSAVKILATHGIEPDFQFSMEATMVEIAIEYLEFRKDIPAVLNYKAPDHLAGFFDTALLCPIADKASPYIFKKVLDFVSPSTLNLAVSLAMTLQPSTIYFLGCDFGYKDIKKNHASGGIYDTPEEGNTGWFCPTQLTDMSQTLVEANFPEQKVVQTTPFLTHTRIAVEGAIAGLGRTIDCVNLSDGAKVKGAVPARSAKIKIKGYNKKKEDVARIIEMFRPAKEGNNWEPYEQSGQELIESFKKVFLKNVELEEFSWVAFNKMIDSCLQDAVAECRTSDTDRRLDIYVRFFVDLLSSLYCTTIFHDDEKAAEEVYRFGVDKLKQIIASIVWPIDA